MNTRKENAISKYVKFSAIAFQMGIIIGAGTYFGIWLDEKFPSSFSIFTVVFSLLSVFISLFIVIKQLQEVNKNNN